jgi:hypothetical protein
LFLIAFVGVGFAFIIDSAGMASMLGAACCALALILFRSFEDNDVAEQFALAVSLLGQILIAIGLGQYIRPEDAGLYLVIAAVEAGLAIAVPNFLHRVLATGAAAVALAWAVNRMSLHGLAAPLLCIGLVLIWLEPRRWAAAGSLWRPVGYGLVLALLLVETFRLLGVQEWFGVQRGMPGWFELHGPLLGRAMIAAVLAWLAFVVSARENPDGRASPYAVGGAVIFGLHALKAPGLASAVLVLLLGFAAGNRLLAALGVLSLLGFVSHFYYNLEASLLAKSGILALTGICLLAAHVLLRPSGPTSAVEEPDHA